MVSIRRWAVFGLVLTVLIGSVPVASAQLNDILNSGSLGGADGLSGADSPETVVSLEAHFTAPTAGRPALLSVTATIAPPYYTYSTTQKPQGATPTQLTLKASNQFRLTGDFRSTQPPKVVNDQELGIVLEEFAGEVTWQAPLELAPGTDLKNLVVAGEALIQVCKEGTCLQPTDFPFEARLKDEPAPAATANVFSNPNVHAKLRGEITPGTVTPGSTVNLQITAETTDHYHIYALAARDPKGLGNKPTLIALENSSGFRWSMPQASSKPTEAPSPAPGLPAQSYHEGTVTWTVPIQIPADTRPGSYPIEGIVGYQTCTDTACDPPTGARFSATINVGPKAMATALPLAFSNGKYNDAAKIAAAQPEPIGVVGGAIQAAPVMPLPLVLVFALLGGFILNFMPCVLPVIGLKILSFAEQAGRSRAQILALNLWYSLGTLSVFIGLATLATAVHWGLSDSNLGWGEQFQHTWFNVAMACLVFSMALSFLGVWEIPIPGFVGAGKANDLAAKEGAPGAFAKGVLATVLATPCSGPMLGPVFGYLLNQPPLVTYLVFICVGLGMSLPYLLIGAFPTLIRFLPRPGAWMDTFKQLMGFVLLGTVVYLFTVINKDYVVPTFALLVGIWAGCWWIGRTSLTEALGRKLLAWGEGAAVAALVGWFAFTWLAPHDSIIPWKPFSQSELARLNKEGSTVLVDFTADWCPTCKLNLFRAIEQKDVRDALAERNIVPLLADFTERSPEIKSVINSLQSNSIPLLAIYPADAPDKPIILRDLISKQQLLEAIRQVGPSKGTAELTAARE